MKDYEKQQDEILIYLLALIILVLVGNPIFDYMAYAR